MGSRSSKESPASCDSAPEVSAKDISNQNDVQLPVVIVTPEEVDEVKANDNDAEENGHILPANCDTNDDNDHITSDANEIAHTELQQSQSTSVAVETTEVANEIDHADLQQPQITSVTTLETTETSQNQKANPQEEPKESHIPSWVNKDNFKPLLVKLYPNFAEIVSFKAYPALAAGENYASLMLKVKITIKLQDASTTELSYMLKVAHDNKEMREMLEVMNIFDTENAVYTSVVPEMEEMYRQAGVTVQFGAKAYQLAPEAPLCYYVLMEDLSLRSFKNANRLECLDMEHTQAVLRKLAQFHAASACRVAAKGAYAETFSPDMDNATSRAMMSQMFGSFKKPFMDNIRTYDNGERYEAAMDKFFDNVLEDFIYNRKANPEFFNVLNHGDTWSNNILFNYTEDGKVDDVLFVDFQNTNYGSLAQDLFYFIISSVRVDIKVSQYEYFVHYYHQHLEENLRLLKYPAEKIPNLRELHQQLIARGFWATMTSFFVMGVVLLDPTDNANIANFMGEQQESMDFKNSVFTNPRYIKYINEILPWLFNHGFMETNHLGNNIAATDKLTVPSPATNSVPSKFSYPEWVNESYFEDIIRSDCGSYQQILKFDVSPATSAGDNYSSIMLKVDIDVQLSDNSNRSLSYMLKIPPTGEQAQAILALLGSFVKEIMAYNDIVPQFEKVFKEQADIDVVFGPKSFKPTQDSGCQTLILENLRVKGFKNCDRLQGLDMDHTKAVLKKMSQLHAASASLFETQGRYPPVYERSIYTEEFKTNWGVQMKIIYDIYLSCVQEFNGNEEYIGRLKTFIDNAYECLGKALSVDFEKFNVLNHGDCWTNNIMFQYDAGGDIANTYFVDFQLMRYGSPAYDLYYFLLTSPKLELKMGHFDYFIRYYHEHLKASLELLKYPKEIPTLKELHVELLGYGSLAMYSCMSVMSAVLLDPTGNASLEEIMKSDESGRDFKRKMFSSQRYRSHCEALLPWMSRRGLMDLNIELPKAASPTEDPKQSNTPSWIDAEHFEDILKKDFENFAKITSITASPATKSGDNYASSLLRIKAEASLTDGNTATKSYILKLPLESEQGKGMVDLWNLFENEIAMYSKYLPEFEELCSQYGGKFNMCPKFYKFGKDVGKDVLLLEDLGQWGFKCGNRREGLDMEHTKCVLEKMALFHSVSAKYVELNGPFPEIFHKGIYTEETRELFESVDRSIFYDYFKQFDNNEEYLDKVPNLLKTSVDQNIRDYLLDPTEFNVLNHGDSWLNNIMFKHDEAGNIEDTYYVDYQVCKYGTPAQDLWYFIISSTGLDIKVDSFDYFIRYYHEQLVDNLKMLQFAGKVPTLNELHQTMLKYGHMGYNTSIGTTTVCLLESSENANITNFTADTPEGKRFRDALFLNDKYKAHAAVVYPWLARRGCLD